MPHGAKLQEKKYRVESFRPVLAALKKLGTMATKVDESIHYYAGQDGDDVLKLVVHDDTAEVHKLKARSGSFELVGKLPMTNAKAGLAWLRQEGYKKLDVVIMQSVDYRYKGGTIGLYTVNNDLYSVILAYPAGEHSAIAGALGLGDAEPITIPYNKYLQQIGKIQYIDLE
jgi:hypothetical protein